MTIYDRIKKARLDAGLTQQELADKLGVTFQAVSSWESGKYIPDTWHLIELAKVLNVSVSSLCEEQDFPFKTVKALYDWEHMRTYVKSAASVLGLKNTLKALTVAIKAHEGQFRKNSDVPYIYHPLSLACEALALSVTDDHVVAACLLHDVLEDTDMTEEYLSKNFDQEVVDLVKTLTFTGSKEDKQAVNAYYKTIGQNAKATLIKCMDRCNNLTSMAYGMDRKGIYKYIKSTEEHYPALLKVLKTDYSNPAWILSYHIKSMLDIYKRLM